MASRRPPSLTGEVWVSSHRARVHSLGLVWWELERCWELSPGVLETEAQRDLASQGGAWGVWGLLMSYLPQNLLSRAPVWA